MSNYTGPDRRRREGRFDRLVVSALAAAIVVMLVAIGLSIAGLRAVSVRAVNDRNTCKVANAIITEVDRTNGLLYVLAVSSQERSANRGPKEQERSESFIEFVSQVKHFEQIDCQNYVDDPRGYKVPEPVPYGEYLRRGGTPPVDLP